MKRLKNKKWGDDSLPERLLMLIILEDCIRSQTLPAINSQCHMIIKWLIRQWKKELK